MLGLSAAVGGTWVERNGPRKAMFVAACFWASGFLVGALGIGTGQLWLVYLGYGVIGGIGLGIGYISPVSTLIKWFPDRPGLATGLAIMGFGGGALVASPLSRPTSAPPPATEVIMMFGVFNIRVPADGWAPPGFDSATVRQKALVTTGNVSAANAIKTPQFWLLWIVLFCNVTAGIGRRVRRAAVAGVVQPEQSRDR
nr:MFS transporter [Kribbella shirazensis]